jgi:DNA processing protein
MTDDKERIYWLAWSQIRGVGPVLIKRIQQHFGSLAQAWRNPINDLWKIDGIGGKLGNIIQQERGQIVPEQLFLEHSQKNPHFWTPADFQYPRLLLEIPSPPAVLYYQGQVEAKENEGVTPLIGIVGTREPTEHGRRWTQQISATLAKHGFTVVSGLATGIDSYAHRGCLDGRGRTIAVLGTGVDVVYPAHNRQLYEEIQTRGLLLSEYPAGTTAARRNFPARNRIIAGLCRAILVMEAPEKSGALITARYANEFGRDVYSLPNSPDNVKARGCLRLIHKGAEVIITEHELLSMLGAIPELDRPQQLSMFEQPATPVTPKLEPPLATVFAAIASSPTSFDAIVQQSGLSGPEVSGILLQLELDGLVSQLPGMHYQKSVSTN